MPAGLILFVETKAVGYNVYLEREGKNNMNINREETRAVFEKLATFGANPEGGITRLSWSSEFKDAQNYLKEYMESIGLTTEVDEFGSLIGTLTGTEDLPPVYTGSHLDSVPKGGAFDGALGIIAGLSCAQCWHAEGFRPKRTLKVVAFAEEEGTAFSGFACVGSQVLSGELLGRKTSEFTDKSGETLEDKLRAYGAPLTEFKTAPNLSKDSKFIELHIEQGRFLDEKHIPVGIVTAIVGIKRFQVLVHGTANHGGTTAMDHRQDALVAASHIIHEIYTDALGSNNLYVATVGSIKAAPNAENVVPGEVQFSVEIRAAAQETLEAVKETVLAKFKVVEETYGVKLENFGEVNHKAVPMDAQIQDIMVTAADKLKIEYMAMPSWAGHDAMIMANHMPTAMIFVPSINGISHSPKELTSWEDIHKGIEVLEGTLRTLCKE